MDISKIKFLQSKEGQALLELAATHQNLEKRIMALRKKTNGDNAALVSQQTHLRIKAQNKFSKAHKMLFDNIGLEQATKEEVALHVAKRFSHFDTVADLTCGIGGDALFLTAKKNLFVVDYLKHKVALCLHNLKAYEKNAFPIVANSANWFPKANAYFLDPSRRHSGQRWFNLEDCEPGLKTIHKLLKKSNAVAVKVSPGLNYRYLNFPCEIEVISHKKECKQIILWCGDLAQVKRRATLLPQNISLESNETAKRLETKPLGLYLYEVEKVVLRANLIDVIAKNLHLSLLCPRLSYLTADTLVSSPWVHAYKIIEHFPFSLKKLKAYIRDKNLQNIALKCRGFCDTEVIWKKRLNIKTKTTNSTLFLTRIQNKQFAIFTEKI